MTVNQTAQFAPFAGQLVSNGIDDTMPIVALEQTVDKTVLANLQNINGLMPKITDVFIRETRVFNNPLERYITKFDNRFGAGLEQAAFMVGAYNEKHDGTCVPRGTPNMTAQLDLVNFAYSVDVDVKDREIDKAVLDEQQRGAYVAQKMRTPLKTIATMKYRAWVQLLSDVISGTRSISSTVAGNSKGAKTGSSTVTYSPTITGYAGKVETITGVVMPMVEVGTQYVMPSAEDALNICNKLKSIAADFKFETDQFNVLGIETFSTGVPLLIAETKVLDAMDTVFAEENANGTASGYGYAGFPTVTAREYLRQFAELVEIDTFAALPTNSSYAGQAVHFVLIDRDAFVEVVKWADMEGQRCAKQRLMGYNYAGESVLSIWRGVNSYAMLFPTEGS